MDAHVCQSELLWTDGTTAYCTQAEALVENIDAGYLLADNAYDSDYIIEMAANQGIQAVLPPKKNGGKQCFYDKHVYKMRHLVENAFLHLKRWRGIATRYAKNTSSFLGAVHICCLALWLKIS